MTETCGHCFEPISPDERTSRVGPVVCHYRCGIQSAWQWVKDLQPTSP